MNVLKKILNGLRYIGSRDRRRRSNRRLDHESAELTDMIIQLSSDGFLGKSKREVADRRKSVWEALRN